MRSQGPAIQGHPSRPAQSPSGNTAALVPEGKARGFRESGPDSTAPRPPVARDYKSGARRSLHPVLVPAPPLPPALCPGPEMASTCAKAALALLLALVAAVIPEPGQAQVSIHPREALLPRGGSVLVNCSSSCTEDLSLGLETQWLKDELESGPNWTLFELSDVREDSSPLCFENCGSTQSSASATITVYAFPEHVELAPLPAWQQVGKNLTLRCRVAGGAPRTQLSAVLLRGEETLSRQPVGGDPQDPEEITFTMLASRGHHRANFSCRTELDLRPQGLGLFSNVSEDVGPLRTFDLPGTNLKLDTPDLLEVGTQQKLLCSLEGLFPASEAQIYLELGGRRLTQESTTGRDFVSTTAFLEVTEKFDRSLPLRCVLKLADQILEMQRTLTIYNFSAPVLTLSQLEVSAGSQVTVNCEAHGGAQVRLSNVSSEPPTAQVQFTLNASWEDNGRRFFCSAVLEVAGKSLSKNQTVKLDVLYGPRLDERDCLGNWTWQEGSQQTLHCQAWGNPTPQLTCLREKDGAPLPIGEVKSVKREMNGTYKCHAVSSHGNVTRDVYLIVLYHRGPDYWVIIIVVLVVVIVISVGLAIYIYNYQRKIRKYKLQKAQEEAMKLKAQAPPP